MILFDFRRKKNGVPILTKEEVENMAEGLLRDYKPELLEEPGILDIELFSQSYLGLEMDYQDLTHNQSIIGMMVFSDCVLPVYDVENNKAKKISVEEGTVLIDNSLLSREKTRRGRFTIGHENSHWLLHRHIYQVNKNQMSLFDIVEKQPVIKCRSIDVESTGGKKLETDDDWIEWQADQMASALLMPRNAFKRAAADRFKVAGLKNDYYEMGTDIDYDLWAEYLPQELADIFDVSITAARVRLKKLNIIREPDLQEKLC